MKKHRKLLTLGVVICLVAGLVAGIVYYKQVEEERKLSLIYIPKVVDGTNDFWTSLIQGAEMAAKEYNADIRVWAPEEENDVDGQNKLIERATEEKPDAILISPSSFTESDQLLKKAKEQGIHIAHRKRSRILPLRPIIWKRGRSLAGLRRILWERMIRLRSFHM